MALTALLQFPNRSMHGRLVIHALEERASLVTFFKASPRDVCALSEDAAKEASRKRTVGDVVHTMLAKQGQQTLLVVATDGIVLALVIAWLHKPFFVADIDVVLYLLSAEVRKTEL